MTDTTLDLSGEITEEQYRSVLDRLLADLEQWRSEQRWCTDFWKHVNQLSASLVFDRYNERMRYLVPETGEERAQDLRDIRGRILRFVEKMPGRLDLDKANEFLSGAGLETFEPEGGFTVEREFYLSPDSFDVTTTLTKDQILDEYRKFLVAVGCNQVDSQVTYLDIDDQDEAEVTLPEGVTVELLRYIR